MGLGSSREGSIFEQHNGMLTWIAAARYDGYLLAPSMPHPEDTDITGQEAYTTLVATVSGHDASCVDGALLLQL